MLDSVLRAARLAALISLVSLAAACGDPETAEPDGAGVETAESEPKTRSDTALEAAGSESPGLDEAREIDEFEAAGQDEDAETFEVDVAEDFELLDSGEIDPLESMYDEFRSLAPMEPEEAMFAVGNADPMVRAHGALNLEPEGGGLDQLLQLAAYDPDPVVRIAALARLEEGESFAALKGVIDALQDPDSDVVVAAIDSVEFAGDSSNVRDLEPLLTHYDQRVARAAAKAIEYLAD